MDNAGCSTALSPTAPTGMSQVSPFRNKGKAFKADGGPLLPATSRSNPKKPPWSPVERLLVSCGMKIAPQQLQHTCVCVRVRAIYTCQNKSKHRSCGFLLPIRLSLESARNGYTQIEPPSGFLVAPNDTPKWACPIPMSVCIYFRLDVASTSLDLPS